MDPENLAEFFKGKRLVVIGGVLAVLLIVLMIFSTRPKSQVEPAPQPYQTIQPPVQTDIFNNTQDEAQSPEVQQAIAEQKQADQEYNNWQQGNSDAYSWIRKLPLTADNYFVYFDLNKKVFIGRLYPKSGDNVDQIKADVLNKLKTEKEIPVENFKVEWMVNP